MSHLQNRIFPAVIFIIITALLNNVLGIIDDAYWLGWKRNIEYLVVGRLAQSLQTGPFSYGGLLGIINADDFDLSLDAVDRQYVFYTTPQGPYETYWTYKSVPGFQGVIFYYIKIVLGLEPSTSIQIFTWLMISLMAITLTIFVLWLMREFGRLTFVLNLVYISFSPWVLLFAPNFYWNLWVFYLAFLVMTVTFAKGYPSPWWVFGIMHGLVFVKILFNGFEYITTAIIMSSVPIVYYSLLDRWQLRNFVIQMGAAISGATAAIASGLATLTLQITLNTGNYRDGLAHWVDAFGRRATGNPDEYSGIYAESLRASTFSVVWEYLNGPALVFVNARFSPIIPSNNAISYLSILILVMIISTILIYWLCVSGKRTEIHRKTIALLVTTWYSLLAPLSWLIIFKAHSYIHTFMNYIVWQMPFMFFGIALIGYFFSNLATFLPSSRGE